MEGRRILTHDPFFHSKVQSGLSSNFGTRNNKGKYLAVVETLKKRMRKANVLHVEELTHLDLYMNFGKQILEVSLCRGRSRTRLQRSCTGIPALADGRKTVVGRSTNPSQFYCIYYPRTRVAIVIPFTDIMLMRTAACINESPNKDMCQMEPRRIVGVTRNLFRAPGSTVGVCTMSREYVEVGGTRRPCTATFHSNVKRFRRQHDINIV